MVGSLYPFLFPGNGSGSRLKSSLSPFLFSLLDRGIFAGYPDGTFHPDQPITRMECAAALYRLLAAKGETPWKTS